MKTRTSTLMRNELANILQSISDFLLSLGILWKYLINGIIGATVWAVYRKEKLLTALRQIIIGGFVAGYSTNVIVHKASIPLDYVGFLSFVIGMLGMVIIDSIYKYALNNYKKWKEIFKILFTK